MSLMFCRQEKAAHPYYVDVLGLNIYTSQELCYVIYHHPLLVLDDFVDDHLIDFIRDELNMAYLAGRLEKWRKGGDDPDELLVIILQECFYYRPSEVNDYRQHLINLRKKHKAEYCKEKADYLFSLKQYGRAVPAYEKCLEFTRDSVVDDEFLGKVWSNMGSAYARMFQWEKAAAAFEKSYGYLKDTEIVKKLYYMTVFCPRLSMKDKYKKNMTEELKGQWDREMEEARQKAMLSEDVRNLEKIFEKDPLKRSSQAASMIHQWKQEYRNMI